jgi:hypothetical protein
MDIALVAMLLNTNIPYLQEDLKLVTGTVFSRFEGETECHALLIPYYIYILYTRNPENIWIHLFLF